MFEYRTLADLLALAQQHDMSVAQVVLQREAEEYEITKAEVIEKMQMRIKVCADSVKEGLYDQRLSMSGMVGRDAEKIEHMDPLLLGNIGHRALLYALAVSEGNAKMHKIVACPTAGSCGIVPAAVFAVGEAKGANQERYCNAFFTAAGIGNVIAKNACIAGAVGGCQAECGTAAAMAAAAVVDILGGSSEQLMQAATLALKNTLGLVCDPVAELVEVPCVKRNGFYAVHALTAAEMAMAGVKSVIPPDEVVTAMYEIGRMIPVALRETSEGGLAKTPTARTIQKKLQHMN
ncbi:L-serine ammonia-lyase, iron-sulfur-dependent, subunit alpha [Pectinatus frisingensis]|uniref:L-serine ammonia-lyase, iron-sulfur-dependent, subunit alpha n=1 Tax=Pectinatus frisingensis TaxID=865 RepID=UPI0015F555EB|nr:L-serine ammonia-lyase, iron-sulfur-dependent, subunit alpha [Pectinatus frisingensis]